MLTRQEHADRLLELGLDRPTLSALIQAVESVKATGYGTVTLQFQQGQITLWRTEITGKPVRE